MPRSSRHKSHKQSKHSSRDYSDSEEEVIKTKEKSSKDDNSTRAHRDLASGEKRKISSHSRDGNYSEDLIGHGNGEVFEEYVSSKRRKEKTDVVGGDRWSGGIDERGDSDRDVEKEMHKGEGLKFDSKSKEYGNKSEALKTDSKNKSKRYESGISGERKEESLASIVVGKEESKSKGESKRRSERDSSVRKEGKEVKEKDHRLDKEKNGGHEKHKSSDAEAKLVDMDVGKKQASQLGNFGEERQGKRSRENTDRTLQDELQNSELEKEVEKKMRRKREGSGEREKHYVDSKEGDERRLSSRGDLAKDVKYRDDKHKDGGYADKYLEDGHKDERRRDEKYWEVADKDSKYQDDKYREDGEKDARHRSDRHREDGDRDGRRKVEKHHKDGERDGMRKDDKYREVIEREGRRDDKYYEDGDRDSQRKDGRYHGDGDKDVRRGDERYLDGSRDDRRRDLSYRDEGNRDNRHKEEKNRKDIERDNRHKDSKQGDGHNREKRLRETKYRDELTSKDRSGDKSDLKHSRDDDYAADYHAKKSSAYDDSPTYDDRTTRSRDDQGRRKTNEKEEYGDIRYPSAKDQRSDAEKKSSSSARMDPATDRVRSTSRTTDVELNSGHNRRRSSPASSVHATRDNYRALRQDESKYRDYNYDERVRHSRTSSRDTASAVGGAERSPPRSLEKLDQKDDGRLQELSAERLSRADVRWSIDVEESTQRSSASRDWKEYSGKEVRGSWELGMDVHPGDELLQADADTLSVSSPFMRNSHFSSSSKSYPPPPFRTGVDSPSILGSAEDEGRGKSNVRHRRIGDPNMGRTQGNSWRGVPNWPSPVANGFLPFPPPVNFHSIIHPFPAPPMFGVRPSMELDHPAPYHMPDADGFSGPGRPMGWRNQIENSGPPLHAWAANNTVFGDESHIYGRSDWDHTRTLPGSRVWETSKDLWKGPNRTASIEMPSSDKENGSTRSGDEALGDQSVKSAQNEKTEADQQAESTDLSQSTKRFEKDEVKAPICPEDSNDVAKLSRKDDMPLCLVYLSKLEISADLTEPELFNKCVDLTDMDQSISPDVDESTILYMEDEEAKTSSHKLLSHMLFTSTDDSVFQKSMSLYKKQKENLWPEDDEKLKLLSSSIQNSDQEDQKVHNKSEEMCPKDDMEGVEYVLPNFDMKAESENGLLKAGTDDISKEPVSALDVNLEVNLAVDLRQQAHGVEKPMSAGSDEGSDASFPSQVKDMTMESACNNEEVKLVDTRYGPLLNSDVSPEASDPMMPESSVLSGSVNLSRIHRSPESTH